MVERRMVGGKREADLRYSSRFVRRRRSAGASVVLVDIESDGGGTPRCLCLRRSVVAFYLLTPDLLFCVFSWHAIFFLKCPTRSGHSHWRQHKHGHSPPMAPSKKTCTVLMVDVSSPTMTPHLGWVGDSLSRVVQNRILHAKADEFALVTCGARETLNDVHTEGIENAAAACEQDYEEEYLNISVDVAMACACAETAGVVARLHTFAGDGAVADYLDALTVASDVLVRHERGGCFSRRVLIVTDLQTPCPIDHDFLNSIAAGMRGASVQLVVAVVDGETEETETKNANREMFQNLCDSLNVLSDGVTPVPFSSRSSVANARDVFNHHSVKQTRPTTTFRGDLQLTPWMNIKVWGYKKISEAKPPAMKLFDSSADDTHGDGPMVTRERTFTSYADPDNPKDVPPEMMLSAYPYGTYRENCKPVDVSPWMCSTAV